MELIHPRSRQGGPLAATNNFSELRERASILAKRSGRRSPDVGDWLMSLLELRETNVAGLIITRLAPDVAALCSEAEGRWSSGALGSGPDTADFARSVGAAADALGHKHIGTEHVLFALLGTEGAENSPVQSLLKSAGVTREAALAEFASLEWLTP